MLNKGIFCTLILTLFISASFAQTTDEDYNKNEFFVGYLHQRGEGTSLNGGEGSYTRNLNRYFGIKGDFSAGFRRQTFTGRLNSGGVITTFPVRENSQTYNFLGGIQVKDNAIKSRFKPFAHALFGVGYNRYKNRVECPSGTSCGNLIPVNESSAGFAGAFGGGLDVKVSDKIDFRVVQVDYNPIYFNNGFRNQVRLGIGVVFH